MKAFESNVGVTAMTKDDEESDFPAGDIINDDEDFSLMDNEYHDDSDVAGYTVGNARTPTWKKKKRLILPSRNWSLVLGMQLFLRFYFSICVRVSLS